MFDGIAKGIYGYYKGAEDEKSYEALEKERQLKLELSKQQIQGQELNNQQLLEQINQVKLSNYQTNLNYAKAQALNGKETLGKSYMNFFNSLTANYANSVTYKDDIGPDGKPSKKLVVNDDFKMMMNNEINNLNDDYTRNLNLRRYMNYILSQDKRASIDPINNPIARIDYEPENNQIVLTALNNEKLTYDPYVFYGAVGLDDYDTASARYTKDTKYKEMMDALALKKGQLANLSTESSIVKNLNEAAGNKIPTKDEQNFLANQRIIEINKLSDDDVYKELAKDPELLNKYVFSDANSAKNITTASSGINLTKQVSDIINTQKFLAKVDIDNINIVKDKDGNYKIFDKNNKLINLARQNNIVRDALNYVAKYSGDFKSAQKATATDLFRQYLTSWAKNVSADIVKLKSGAAFNLKELDNISAGLATGNLKTDATNIAISQGALTALKNLTSTYMSGLTPIQQKYVRGYANNSDLVNNNYANKPLQNFYDVNILTPTNTNDIVGKTPKPGTLEFNNLLSNYDNLSDEVKSNLHKSVLATLNKYKNATDKIPPELESSLEKFYEYYKETN